MDPDAGGRELAIERTREKLRLEFRRLLATKDQDRARIWNPPATRYPLRCRPPVSNLIPGLPDDLVELHIWPRIRAMLEDVVLLEVSDTPRVKTICLTVRSVAHINRKWRHLITNSIVWAALISAVTFCRRRWASLNTFFFRDSVRAFPPIDVWSRLPHAVLMQRIDSWLLCDSKEVDCYLSIYAVEQERVESWKTTRLHNYFREQIQERIDEDLPVDRETF